MSGAAAKLAVGSRVRVKANVCSPDFPDVSFAGWTATVMELSGKKPNQKFIIEFDDSVIAAMPAEYLKRCEDQHLLYTMACLTADDLEAA